MKEQMIPILISIYAAIISTITLIWNILNSILDKMSRIEVNANFYTTMAFKDSELEQGPGVLQIAILNKSKRIKYIKIPQLELSYNHGLDLGEDDKKKNMVNLYLAGINLTFPIEMKPESEIILKYPLGKGSEWIYKNAKENDTFRVVIKDTTKKEYKSNHLQVKELKCCVEHNSKISSDLISQIIRNN
ncbi:hypothetical protein [Clostridium cadaveris]